MKKLLPILILSLLISCNSKKKEKDVSIPDTVFSIQQMQCIMYDMCLTEAFIRQKGQEGFSTTYYTTHYYDLLFEKYDSDSSKLINSYKFYARYPTLLKELNQKVLDSLIVSETKMN